MIGGNGYHRAFPKCFFGGGGGQQDNSAMYYAQAQQAAAQERQAKAALDFQAQQAQQQHQWSLDAASAADAKAATDKQNAITQFQNDLGTATGGARTYAQQQEGNLGISGNDYGLMNNFNNLLQSTLSGIGSQQTGNAGALVNGQSLFDAANSATLSQQRNKLTQQYNALFGNNYAQNNLDETSLLGSDEANALSSQQADAQAQIDRAKARGTLNDTGYSYAQQQLAQQAAAARAKIQAAGSGVISGYQQKLQDALSGAKSSLSNWQYGDPTDINSISSSINNSLSKYKANASGDFQNAIAGQSYFDPTTLLSKAGTYQGTTGTAGTTTPATGTPASGTNTGFLSSNPLATKPVSGNGTLGNQGIV